MPPPNEESPRPVTGPNGSNKSMVVIGLVVLILIIGVASYYAFRTQPANQAPNLVQIAPAAVSVTSAGFSPQTVTVKVGQGVVWTNSDVSHHTVTSDNPKPVFSSGQDLKRDDSFSYVFDKTGTYPYHDGHNIGHGGIVIVR